MQVLTTFYEDNKVLAMAAAAAAVLILLVILYLLYRLLFGRRLRTASNGRVRQPRLGIVDAYDLDRQRQLVLVRRDNVEHLIMIGGPTDVVIESSIVRAQQQQPIRDKETGPLVGTVTSPPVISSTPQAPTLGPGPVAQDLAAPAAGRTEPPIAPPRPVSERPQTAPDVPFRAEPSPSPVAGAVAPRPIAVPQQPGIGSPPRVGAVPAPVSGPNTAAPSSPEPGSGAPAARPPLPSRIPPRQPLPPRPAPGSTLPPRPLRPLPPRTDPAVRPAVESPLPPPASVLGAPSPAVPPVGPGPGAEPEPRVVAGPSVTIEPEVGNRRVEPPPLSAEPTPPGPSQRTETLDSLEEEMAKLLGRPLPRRDG